MERRGRSATTSSRRITMLAWFLIGAGIWTLLSLPLEWWMVRSQGGINNLVGKLPFYEYFFRVRSFPEFYPITAVVAILVIATGVGLRRRKGWTRTCAFTYIGSAVIGGTYLCVRYSQTFGGIQSTWPIWVSWTIGMVLLGFIGFCLVRRPVKLELPLMKDFWSSYDRFHWKLVRGGLQAFGISAVIVGSVTGLWGMSLLLTPSSVIMVNSVPTTAVGPKLAIVLSSLFFILIGVIIYRIMRSTSRRT